MGCILLIERNEHGSVEDRVQASNASTQDARAAIATLGDLERHASSLDTSPGWIARERPIFWPEPGRRRNRLIGAMRKSAPRWSRRRAS